MFDKKKIGRMFQEARKEKGMTQHQLADMADLSRNYISDIENGRYSPSAETLFRICSILEINLNKLIMTALQE